METIVMMHDLPSDIPGKTWKEKNLEMAHNIPLRSLVEVSYDGARNNGVRLFVCRHDRDCDGTPLYSLTWDMDYFDRFKGLPYTTVSTGGFGEDGLIVIQKPEEGR